jgi:hypothetical protein
MLPVIMMGAGLRLDISLSSTVTQASLSTVTAAPAYRVLSPLEVSEFPTSDFLNMEADADSESRVMVRLPASE